MYFTEKYANTLQEEEGDEDDNKVGPTPKKQKRFFDPKSFCKPKWDDNGNGGGPGDMGPGLGSQWLSGGGTG